MFICFVSVLFVFVCSFVGLLVGWRFCVCAVVVVVVVVVCLLLCFFSFLYFAKSDRLSPLNAVYLLCKAS